MSQKEQILIATNIIFPQKNNTSTPVQTHLKHNPEDQVTLEISILLSSGGECLLDYIMLFRVPWHLGRQARIRVNVKIL